MSEIKELSCKHCGAPIKFKPNERTVICGYCSFTNILQTQKSESDFVKDVLTFQPVFRNLAFLESQKTVLESDISSWEYTKKLPYFGGFYKYTSQNQIEDLERKINIINEEIAKVKDLLSQDMLEYYKSHREQIIKDEEKRRGRKFF